MMPNRHKLFDFLFKDPTEHRRLYKTRRRLSDPEQSLFDIPTYGIFAEDTFSDSLLTDLKFKRRLEKIQSLSSKVPCLRCIPKTADKSKYGTVYIFEVDVFCGENKLEVRERDPSMKERFFSPKLKNTTRVIRIFGTSVRTIEAKLRVHQEYEEDIGSKNILLYHEFEDIDDICNLSENQQYEDLYDDLKLFEESIPVDELPSIVEDATYKALDKYNVRKICNAVHIWDGDEDVGTGDARPYVCYSIFTVRRIKKILAEKTLEDLARSLGSEICKGILRHIESKIQTKLDHQFKNFDIHLSEETLLRMTVVVAAVVVTIIFSLFGFILEAIVITVMAVYVYIQTVDVNSYDWRNKTADEVHRDVIGKRQAIIEKVMPTVRRMCVGTQNELKLIMEKIVANKKAISLVDPTKLVNQWKKREVIQDRKALIETCPSFLNYIAGEKNGQSVVVVFLQDDDKERVKEYFTRKCKHHVDYYEIVNVNNDLRNKSDDSEGCDNSLDKIEREKMQDVMSNVKGKVFALHSSVVGLGVGCLSGKLKEPCFVLYCVDKLLVPFGEKELPDRLGGYPVELRVDYVMFGHDQSLEEGSSDVKPFLSKEGSIHMRVKSRSKNVSLLDSRFLTPAHVAPTFLELYKTGALLAENPSLERVQTVVHPPSFKRDGTKTVQEKVENVRSGTSGGVQFHRGKSIGLSDVQLFEEDDLRDGELYITNEGQTTKCTDETLIGVGFTIAIDLPLPAGVFVCFPNCIIIQHPDVHYLKEGDKGSGILIKKSNQPKQLLGIAFAMFKRTKQTAVCDIKHILNAFDFFVYDKQSNTADMSSEVILYKRVG